MLQQIHERSLQTRERLFSESAADGFEEEPLGYVEAARIMRVDRQNHERPETPRADQTAHRGQRDVVVVRPRKRETVHAGILRDEAKTRFDRREVCAAAEPQCKTVLRDRGLATCS